jgi:hypothetical protein
MIVDVKGWLIKFQMLAEGKCAYEGEAWKELLI